jgi:malate synthase
MEDAATAEISRSQVWQWIRSPKGKLEDSRKVTAEMVRGFTIDELEKVKLAVGGDTKPYERAAKIFEEMSTSENFTEFLTLPLYEEL